MVNERTAMLLNQLSVQQIDEVILQHYNYNGLDAHADLQRVATADAARRQLRRTVPLWIGMTAVSGYNLTRINVLSNSGRIGAIGGLALGAVMTLATTKM